MTGRENLEDKKHSVAGPNEPPSICQSSAETIHSFLGLWLTHVCNVELLVQDRFVLPFKGEIMTQINNWYKTIDNLVISEMLVDDLTTWPFYEEEDYDIWYLAVTCKVFKTFNPRVLNLLYPLLSEKFKMEVTRYHHPKWRIWCHSKGIDYVDYFPKSRVPHGNISNYHRFLTGHKGGRVPTDQVVWSNLSSEAGLAATELVERVSYLVPFGPIRIVVLESNPEGEELTLLASTDPMAPVLHPNIRVDLTQDALEEIDNDIRDIQTIEGKLRYFHSDGLVYWTLRPEVTVYCTGTWEVQTY